MVILEYNTGHDASQGVEMHERADQLAVAAIAAVRAAQK
jgi:hypothetical protein